MRSKIPIHALAAGLLVSWGFAAAPVHAEGTLELGTQSRLQADTVLAVDITDTSTESIRWSGTGSLTIHDPDGVLVATLNPAVSISAIDDSGPGGTVVIVTAANHGMTVGEAFTVTGANNGSNTITYNGSYTVATVDSATQITTVEADPADGSEPDPARTTGNVNRAVTRVLTGFAAGTYGVTLSANQTSAWDIAVVVNGSPVSGGRLHSKSWHFFTNTFDGGADAMNTSFYPIVPGGAPLTDATLEVRFAGLQGNDFRIAMNSTGVDGENAGRSIPCSTNNCGGGAETAAVTPEYDIFLNPPARRVGGAITPTLTNSTFVAGQDGQCGAISDGGSTAAFSFETSAEGAGYKVVCDLNEDGSFDVTAEDDLLLSGDAIAGVNQVAWDGLDRNGNPIPAGVYDCGVFVSVGELHFVGRDIETSREGMRMFEVGLDGTRTPLAMFWNDALVQASEDALPPAPENPVEPGVENPGPDGMDSGDPLAAADDNVNARAWGNFDVDGASKGNSALLDTFVISRASAAVQVQFESIDRTLDSDGDLLPDVREICELGTRPDLADTDGDGISDGNEVLGSNPSNPLVVDSDGDGIGDGVEDTNQNGVLDPGESNPNLVDSDGDGLNDNLEDANQNGVRDGAETDATVADSDGDGLLDGDEDENGNGVVDVGETDPRLTDSDGDGLADGIEDTNGNGVVDPGETNPTVADTDGDGLADGVEDLNHNGVVDPGESDPGLADTDGDGLLDGVEDANGNGSVDPGETSPILVDSDGDGTADGVEDANGNGVVDAGETDPTNPDSDGDGIPDGVEDKNGNGVVDPGETSPIVVDTDGDGFGDGEEDVNHNGVVDPGETDPTAADDSDGDGLGDGIEDTNRDGVVDPGETDPNNSDSDGDGIADGVEDANHNGVVDAGETDPRVSDSDGDGLSDGEEDADQDGVVDPGETDPRNPDSDGDGEPDGVEFGQDEDGDGINDAIDADETDGPLADPDEDGLNNAEEAAGGTDPNDSDSDDDGILDGADVGPADPCAPDPDASACTGQSLGLSPSGGGLAACSSGPHAPWAMVLGGGLLLRRRRRRTACA